MLLDKFLYDSINENPRAANISRSFIKSITWRVIGTLDTIVISYFITGQIKAAISIGGVELVTKMSLYFVHERIWEKIKWGKWA